MFYVDAALAPGARLVARPDHEERAVYVLTGRLEIDGTLFESGQMLVLRTGAEIAVTAPERARVLLFGGEPMDGPRKLWWNFVASTPERIERGKADWRAGRLGSVPGESEFIPLPEEQPHSVMYP
jgi:redox-sensitive bicupin YhaK (pirin superfamily)